MFYTAKQADFKFSNFFCEIECNYTERILNLSKTEAIIIPACSSACVCASACTYIICSRKVIFFVVNQHIATAKKPSVD